jgi:hypothetical protein
MSDQYPPRVYISHAEHSSEPTEKSHRGPVGALGRVPTSGGFDPRMLMKKLPLSMGLKSDDGSSVGVDPKMSAADM